MWHQYWLLRTTDSVWHYIIICSIFAAFEEAHLFDTLRGVSEI
jgi:hypothetical protein